MSKRRTKKTKRTTFVLRDDNRYRIPFNIFFTLMLIFLGGLGTAVSYANINNTQVKISQVRKELQEQKDANMALRTEITQKFTFDEIERIAVERLGMNKPDLSQIIYINVPKQSFVVLNDDTAPPEPEGFRQQIEAFVRHLFQ